MKANSAGVSRRAKNVFYDVAGISAQMTASYRTAVRGEMLGDMGQIKERRGNGYSADKRKTQGRLCLVHI